MAKELTLDILDEAIKAVEEVRNKAITKIYLNPEDWREATVAMQKLSGTADIPQNMALGIPVVTTPTLSRGMFMLEYDTMSGQQLVGWKVKL